MSNRLRIFVVLIWVVFGSACRLSAQWYQFPDLKYTNIYCMITVGDSTVFVGGDNATLLRTTDNGNSWKSVMGGSMYADTILSLAYGDGYVFAGANGVESVYRSSDDGTSWNVANTGLPPNARMNALALSGDTIFAATDQGVYSSADSGATWNADTNGLAFQQLYPGQGGGTVGIATAGGKVYTIKSLFGSVYSSPAGKVSWTQIAPDTFNMGYAIAAMDTNILIGTLKGVYLYRDGTWVPRNNGLPADTATVYSCIFAKVDTLLFADFGLRNGPFYVTSDLGATWTQVSDTSLGGAAVSIIAGNENYLFAGTERGVWRIPLADAITAVNKTSPVLPAVFVLHQNYPNPFNPTTNIEFRIADLGFVTLKVYNVLGQEVATLVNGMKRPGDYTVRFNGTGLASGVYFYRLSASSVSGTTTGYTKAVKMILLK